MMNELVQENEKSRDILIEQRFHRMLIGAKGEGIKLVRDKFNQVCTFHKFTFNDYLMCKKS